MGMGNGQDIQLVEQLNFTEGWQRLALEPVEPLGDLVQGQGLRERRVEGARQWRRSSMRMPSLADLTRILGYVFASVVLVAVLGYAFSHRFLIEWLLRLAVPWTVLGWWAGARRRESGAIPTHPPPPDSRRSARRIPEVPRRHPLWDRWLDG
jgi:hypothetical protein